MAKNGRAAVLVVASEGMEAYQIKGSAEYLEQGPEVEQFAPAVEKKSGGRMKVRGVLSITPERVIVMSPGPDNKKEL